MTPGRSGPSRGQRPPRARSRNAGASKQALLQAAHELFGQQGFEGTTIRDIGDRAGVDHALIAR
jgi:AcrR family transcriptional regulator